MVLNSKKKEEWHSFFFFFFKRRVFIKAFSFMTSNPKKHWDSKQSCTQPNNCNSLPLLPLLSGGTVILNRFLYNPYVHLLLSLALLLWTWEREREREREGFRLRGQWNRATESPTVTCQAALYFYHLYLILSPLYIYCQ